MAIPEHEKCVRRNKLFRHYKKEGVWSAVRAKRRKEGKLKLKKRIRVINNVELAMQRANALKTFKSCKNWTEFMKMMLGKHYRRWGKYE